MSPRPVAEFLTCFGNELVETFQEIESEPILFASPETPETPEELGDLVEEARSQGISEGFASAEAALEYKLEEQRLFFEERLAAEKSSWRCETAASISNQIKVAIEDMEASFAESAQRILRPFVVKAIIDKLVGELCESVEDSIV